MLEKNDKLEEQMVALSTPFQSIKDDLLLQKIEQPMLMLEQGDTCVKEPWEDDKQEANTGNAAAGAGNQMADEQAVDGSTSSYGGDRSSGKWASRKCNVRICRQDRTLQWPKAESGAVACSPRELPEPLTPGGDLVVTGFDAVINSLAPESMEEYLVADGLLMQTSASSTNASSLNLPLLPAPVSPVQVQPSPLPSTIVARDDDLMVQCTILRRPRPAAPACGHTATIAALRAMRCEGSQAGWRQRGHRPGPGDCDSLLLIQPLTSSETSTNDH